MNSSHPIPEIFSRLLKNDRLVLYTQTLHPKFHGYTPDLQLQKTHTQFVNIMKQMFYYWTFVPELTQHGVVHYHAVACIHLAQDTHERGVSRARAVLGRSQIKPIKSTQVDLDRAWSYIHKDLVRTQDAFISIRICPMSQDYFHKGLVYFPDKDSHRVFKSVSDYFDT